MTRRWRFLPVALACLLASCSRAQPAAPISVMSFNVRYGTANDADDSWPNRAALVADVIRANDPDILGVQEALRFQLDALGTALPDYAEAGVGRDDGREAGEYAAILYRRARFALEQSGTFWFSDTPDVPGSVGWGNRVTRICTWVRLAERASGRSFYVYNVHLDHESQVSRERAAEALVVQLVSDSDGMPAMVLGDFNAGEDNPAMLYLTGARPRALGDSLIPALPTPPPFPGLVDTFREIHPTETDVGTFNAFRGARSGPKIDWILVTDAWQVLDAEIVRTSRNGRYPSDHFPVTARVQLRR